MLLPEQTALTCLKDKKRGNEKEVIWTLERQQL